MPKNVGVVRFVDAGVREVLLEEVRDGVVLEVAGCLVVLVVHPEWAVWVVFEGVVGEPLR